MVYISSKLITTTGKKIQNFVFIICLPEISKIEKKKLKEKI